MADSNLLICMPDKNNLIHTVILLLVILPLIISDHVACLGRSKKNTSAGSSINPPSPVIQVPRNWSPVAAGSSHTIALITNGIVRAWGWNEDYQLGLGDTISRTTPTLITSDFYNNPFEGIDLVTAGSYHTIALKTDGTLWAWGVNDAGQLGTSDTITTEAPFTVGTDSDWYTVATGGGSMTLNGDVFG